MNFRHSRNAIVPTFKPPGLINSNNLSHHDRLTLLLSLHDSHEKEKSDTTASQIHEVIRTPPSKSPSESRAMHTDDKSKSAVTSLFGGAVTYKRPHGAIEADKLERVPPMNKKLKSTDTNEPVSIHPMFATALPATKSPSERDPIITRREKLPQAGITKTSMNGSSLKRKDKDKDKDYNSGSVNERDFQGITMLCHIAGSREEGLQFLIDKCKENVTVMLSIISADEHFSSNLDNTTVKYCTASMKCKSCSWGCERNSRMAKAVCPVLGSVIAIVDDVTREEECFFLPLMECTPG